MQEYLEPSKHIDWQHPKVLEKANLLAGVGKDQEQIARACFKFVRDAIEHSWDYQLNPARHQMCLSTARAIVTQKVIYWLPC